MAHSYSDRACGALLGLAVGDALGVVLEGMSPEQAQIKFGTVDRFLGGGLFLLAPGENTARLALARAAAVALTQGPPLTERLKAGYVAVFESGRPGMGEATRAALERIRDGSEPAVAAREANEALGHRSAGIGPALRCVPYALHHRTDPDALIAAVVADAALTHRDARAGAAAAALALWVREHLNGENDAAAALERVRERLAARPELPDVLPSPGALERLPVRATAYAPDVLHAAARHALATPRAGRAIVAAVAEAGAATALGAATGAIAGARGGASGLPDVWQSVLVGAAAWRSLAARL